MIHRDKLHCRYCNRKTAAGDIEVDHVFPVCFGGLDELDNLVTACRDCNQLKFMSLDWVPIALDQVGTGFMAERNSVSLIAGSRPAKKAKRKAKKRNAARGPRPEKMKKPKGPKPVPKHVRLNLAAQAENAELLRRQDELQTVEQTARSVQSVRWRPADRPWLNRRAV